MSQARTCAPSAASRSACEAPWPRAAPVMMTLLPCSRRPAGLVVWIDNVDSSAVGLAVSSGRSGDRGPVRRREALVACRDLEGRQHPPGVGHLVKPDVADDIDAGFGFLQLGEVRAQGEAAGAGG